MRTTILEEGIPDQRRTMRLFESTLEFVQHLFPQLQANADLRWGNRADFYSLFVALSEIIRDHEIPKRNVIPQLRVSLEKLSREIDRRLGNENAGASRMVIDYVRAIEKGVNEKARRADRHRILVSMIEGVLGPSARGSKGQAEKKGARKRSTKSATSALETALDKVSAIHATRSMA